MEKGLPVSGYRPQSEENIALVNEAKELEERVLRFLDRVAASGRADGRWFSIGRTDIEKGFMAVNRSVFQPARVTIADTSSDETAWLIEDGLSEPSTPRYLASVGRWTSDNLKAIRFARKQDAEALVDAGGLGAGYFRVAEHAWS